jgi:hypothetical protein
MKIIKACFGNIISHLIYSSCFGFRVDVSIGCNICCPTRVKAQRKVTPCQPWVRWTEECALVSLALVRRETLFGYWGHMTTGVRIENYEALVDG